MAATIAARVSPAPSLPQNFVMEGNFEEDVLGSIVRAETKLAVDAPFVSNGKGSVAFTMSVDGEQLLDMNRDVSNAKERAAAGGVFDALQGSELLKRAVPFVDEPVAPNHNRYSYTLADGNRFMVVEPEDAADLPGDAKLKGAFEHYMVESGIGEYLEGATEDAGLA